MTFDLSEYKALYLQTASQKLNDMTQLLEKIIASNDQSAIADFHRYAHSMKSQSLVMGYPQMGLAGKILESLFLVIKNNHTALSTDLVPLVQDMLESMKRSLKSIREQNGEINLSREIQSLEKNTEVRLLDL